MQAGAALGDPDIIIDVTIPSTGFELTTSVGQVRLYSQLDFYAIHVQGGVPLDPYSPLVIDAPTEDVYTCLLYTSPSPRDAHESRMPSSA